MAKLETIWVIHTTSTAKDADTDDKFEVWLPAGGKKGDSPGEFLRTPNLPHDERERGRTDQYEFDVRKLGIDHTEARGNVRLATLGSDGWLPSSIWVIGRTVDGKHHILAARPRWRSRDWFSTDSSEGKDFYTL
jgi:hypothetical protein